MDFQEAVWLFVKGVPRSHVVTYEQAAVAAGAAPEAARAAGNAMNKAAREGRDVPWWRVVKAGGFISKKAPLDQRELLMGEDAAFVATNRIDLDKCQWHG